MGIPLKPEAGDDYRTGRRWLADFQRRAQEITAGEVVFDLSDLQWVNLYEWTSAVALLRSRIEQTECDVTFDFAGGRPGTVSTAAFVAHIGTRKELAQGTTSGIRITGAPRESAEARYHTTLLGLTHVRRVDSAFRFLDDRQISTWRTHMQSRFPDSPLFEHELFWRLLCFELAMNIVEHARSSGYLAAHVVTSDESDRSFDFARAFQKQKSGPFLELCIADAGAGLVSTLANAFADRHGTQPARVPAQHVIEYAVHELGSSKDVLDSWITDRHALARVLSVVEQYGGVLRIRSESVECVFDMSSMSVVRATKRLGYEATSSDTLPSPITGTHIQILLPLQPRNRGVVSPTPLRDALPPTYEVEDKFPIGHYVPLSVYIDDATLNDVSAFVSGCRSVARSLLGRPPNEPVVFDLEESAWTPSHFDTFIGELENVIARRPTLVIGATDALTAELRNRMDIDEAVAVRAAGSGAWQRVLLRAIAAYPALRTELRGTTVTGIRDAFVEVAMSRPFSTEVVERLGAAMREIATDEYHPAFRLTTRDGWSAVLQDDRTATQRTAVAAPDVWHTTLVLDRNGRRTFAGPEPEAYRRALLSLLDDAHTPQALAKAHQLNAARLFAVLTRAQPLFVRDAPRSEVWRCAWSAPTLAPQVRRSVVRNFSEVMELTEAWLGRRPDQPAQSLDAAFYLPLDHEWRDGFLVSAQILTRERYADEIGQRLAGRLRRRLGATEVRAFAAATTPALMVAAALSHWWSEMDGGSEPLPVIDLGDYQFQGREDTVAVSGGVILVQDVLSRGTLTTQLFDALHNRVAAVAAFVALQGRDIETREALEKQAGILETLVKTRGPRRVDWDVLKPGAFLVEMRTLRPVSAARVLEEDRPASGWGRNFVAEVTRHGDSAAGIIRIGHFVTGRRHHVVGVDMRVLKNHVIGARLCDWIAERAVGAQNGSPVVGVLMPLSSQIRTLWPLIRSRLALRGRRVHAWYLEETLQLGDRAMLVPPPGFEAQLIAAARQKRKVDVMVLDDAVITGRTAHKVLTTISELTADPQARGLRSVEYFTLLDRQSGPDQRFTRYIREFGTEPFRVEFSAGYALIGPLLYADYSCPACEQRHGLLQLSQSDAAAHSAALRTWCEKEASKLEPKSLEHGPPPAVPARLHTPIPVLRAEAQKVFSYADHAIVRAFELISRGVPVVYLLDTVAEQGLDDTDPEYERYRWWLLHWCLRHWKWTALMPKAAKSKYRSLFQLELDGGTSLVALLLAEAGLRADGETARGLFEDALNVFANLPQVGGFLDVEPELFNKAVALETGLLAFGAAIVSAGYRTRTDAERLSHDVEQAMKAKIVADVENAVGVQLLQHRLRAKEEMNRGAALESLAETIYRERSPDFSKKHAHDLLPKLLIELCNQPSNVQARHFAGELLGTFVRAAEVIDAYTNAFSVGPGQLILDDVRNLAQNITTADDDVVRQLASNIRAQLTTEPGRFMTEFAKRFNAPLQVFLALLRRRAAAVPLQIEQQIHNDTALMTDLHRLQGHLINIAVDPRVKKNLSGAPPQIRITRESRNGARDAVVFEVTTCYRPFEETLAALEGSPKYAHDVAELQQFGCTVDEPKPADDWPLFRISVPVGFPVRLKLSEATDAV